MMGVFMRRVLVFLVAFWIAISAYAYNEKIQTIQIQGMTCPSCAAAVEKRLTAIPEVQFVKIDIRKGTAVITLKGGQPPTEEQLDKAIKAAGYKMIRVDRKDLNPVFDETKMVALFFEKREQAG